jgi:hypothetical protein
MFLVLITNSLPELRKGKVIIKTDTFINLLETVNFLTVPSISPSIIHSEILAIFSTFKAAY